MIHRTSGALLAMAAAVMTAACSSGSTPASADLPGDAGSQTSHDGGAMPPTDAGGGGTDASPSSSDAGTSPSDDAATPGADGSSAEGGGAEAGAPGRQSLVWVWMDYPDSLAAVAANPSAFTHVSPSLYDLNYAYSSGVAEEQGDNGADDFDGLSSTQIAQKIHAAGMKCIPLIQAGAGNSGTDQGIQNVLSDSPKGAQSSFITSMVQEAVTKGYDGYSLDWETGGGTTYAGYGKALVSFLGAFQAALHQHGMELQLIVGSWFVEQSDCSGDTGFVDLAAVSPSVDQVIMMAYDTTLGTPTATCTPASIKDPTTCGNDFASDMGLMCAYVPLDKINIGYDSDPMAGNNPIAGACVSATQASGITAVAIWPEYNTAGQNGGYAFCDTTDISPSGTTWFDLLSAFLADK
jgi:hypothetical protein